MEDAMKRIKPPLPFAGHKGAWINELTQIAQKLEPNTIVFDCFGGSGTCSHIMKTANPSLRVVFNDFDDYLGDVARIAEIEEIRATLAAEIGTDCHHLTQDEKAHTLKIIDAHRAKYGAVPAAVYRWFSICGGRTLNTTLAGAAYANIRRTPYTSDAGRDWCKNCETTRFDVSEWAPPEDNIFLIIDPPFIASDKSRYGGAAAIQLIPKLFELMEYPHAFFCDSLTLPVFKREFHTLGGEKTLCVNLNRTRQETLLIRL